MIKLSHRNERLNAGRTSCDKIKSGMSACRKWRLSIKILSTFVSLIFLMKQSLLSKWFDFVLILFIPPVWWRTNLTYSVCRARRSPAFTYLFRFLGVLSIMPKIPEISVGIQMERSVSVSSDRNIRDHLWRWSTYFGRNIPTEIHRFIFGIRVLCPN